MTIYFEDVESDGFLDTITKLHCLSSKELGGDIVTHTENYNTHFE